LIFERVLEEIKDGLFMKPLLDCFVHRGTCIRDGRGRIDTKFLQNPFLLYGDALKACPLVSQGAHPPPSLPLRGGTQVEII
jgi:hypothetical protein